MQDEPTKLVDTTVITPEKLLVETDTVTPNAKELDKSINVDSQTKITEAISVTASEVISDDVDSEGIPHVAEQTTLPEGKAYRKSSDYANLDWKKTNAELAREVGRTPQYISQLRKRFESGELKPSATVNPDFSDVQQMTVVKAAVNYELMASTVFDMTVGTMTMVFGPEWQPRIVQAPNGVSINEKDAVVGAMKLYFESKEMKDLPPGVILSFVCLAYCAPRLQAPPTKEKLKLGWTWFKSKLSAFRRKKQPNIAVLPKDTNDNHKAEQK